MITGLGVALLRHPGAAVSPRLPAGAASAAARGTRRGSRTASATAGRAGGVGAAPPARHRHRGAGGVPSARVRDAPAALRDRLHAFLPRCRHGDGQQPARAAPTWRVRGLQRHHDRSARCVGCGAGRFLPRSTDAAGGGAIRAPSACSARRELELLLRVRVAAHESGADRQPRSPGTSRRRAAAGTADGGAADGGSGAGAVAPRPRRVAAAHERTRVRLGARDPSSWRADSGSSWSTSSDLRASCFRPTSRSASGAAAWRRCASPRCWRATT